MPGCQAWFWQFMPEKVGKLVVGPEGTVTFPPWTLAASADPHAPLELTMIHRSTDFIRRFAARIERRDAGWVVTELSCRQTHIYTR